MLGVDGSGELGKNQSKTDYIYVLVYPTRFDCARLLLNMFTAHIFRSTNDKNLLVFCVADLLRVVHCSAPHLRDEALAQRPGNKMSGMWHDCTAFSLKYIFKTERNVYFLVLATRGRAGKTVTQVRGRKKAHKKLLETRGKRSRNEAINIKVWGACCSCAEKTVCSRWKQTAIL